MKVILDEQTFFGVIILLSLVGSLLKKKGGEIMATLHKKKKHKKPKTVDWKSILEIVKVIADVVIEIIKKL